MRTGVVWLGLAAGLLGCESRAPTQVVLVVDADDDLASEIRTVSLLVAGDDGVELSRTLAPAGRTDRWPLCITLVPRDGDRARTFDVNLLARGDDEAVWRLQVTGSYPGGARVLRRDLVEGCRDRICPAERSTCQGGECVPAAAMPGDFAPLSGSLSCGAPSEESMDAGSADAGGPPVDAGDLDAGDADGGGPDAGPTDGRDAGSVCRHWGLPGGCGVIQLSAGRAHTCALTVAGHVYCWGDNARGQLGRGDTIGDPRPARVDIDEVALVAAGYDHTCVVAGEPAGIHCWGDNSRGQLGLGPDVLDDGLLPAYVTDGTAVAAGEYHTCAIDGARVLCWGGGEFGQRGTGDPVGGSRRPERALVEVDPMLDPRIAAGGGFSCLTQGGALTCWGRNNRMQVPGGPGVVVSTPTLAPPGPAGVREVALGAQHGCSLSATGQVVCWGRGTEGQLGIGDTADAPPAEVTATAVKAVAAGGNSSCAISTAGDLLCWGANGSGQLGIGSTARQTLPTLVPSALDPVTLAVGVQHACFADSDGRPWCWGANGSGQLGQSGDADVRAPQRVMDPRL